MQITPNGVNVLYATFNPNGTQVAFNAQWGSSEFKIYRSGLDGTDQFTLTPGEGFNAAFPLWRVNENDEEEIVYLRAEGETSQVAAINPLTTETLWSTEADEPAVDTTVTLSGGCTARSSSARTAIPIGKLLPSTSKPAR